eukprot:m51a1_g2519 putative solute carrier family 35 member f6 isoform x2 (357) ;mRNA; f:216311-217788
MSGMMEIGLLLSGVINTVVTKAADNSYSVGWGGNEHAFNHPWTQTFFMFIAETFILAIFITHKLVMRRRKSDKPQKVETFFELFPPILIVPTILDLCATGVSSIALLYIDASVWQMLSGSLIVFSTILAVTIEERLLKQRNLNPAQVCGMEGFFGLVLSIFIVLPVVYFCPGDNPSSMVRGSYDNAIDAFMQMGHNIPLLFYVLIYILFDAIYNWCSENVEKYLSAVHYCIIDACRSIFVWAWQLLTYYCIEERFGEEWTRWSAFEVAGFACLTVGAIIFHGIVKIPGMSYADLEEEEAMEKKERQKGEHEAAAKDCELGAADLNSVDGDVDLNAIDVHRESMETSDGISVKRVGA